MTLKNNTVASILLNVCSRSSDIDLIIYGEWLKSHGAVPLEYPNESQELKCSPGLAERLRVFQESTAGDQGSATA